MPAGHAADTRRDLARRPALSRAGRGSQEFQVHRMVSFITPGCCFFFGREIQMDRLEGIPCHEKKGGICRSNVDKETQRGGEGPLGNTFSADD